MLYSELTDLNVTLIQKHSHQNIQDDIWPDIWVPWPSQADTKLTITVGNMDKGEAILTDRVGLPLRSGAGIDLGCDQLSYI